MVAPNLLKSYYVCEDVLFICLAKEEMCSKIFKCYLFLRESASVRRAEREREREREEDTESAADSRL